MFDDEILYDRALRRAHTGGKICMLKGAEHGLGLELTVMIVILNKKGRGK